MASRRYRAAPILSTGGGLTAAGQAALVRRQLPGDGAVVTLFGHSGFKPTAHAAVEVAALDYARPFAVHFAAQFAPRLGRRAAGFAAIFAALAGAPAPLLILETGTLRVPGNWEGDGQSTYLFDVYAQCELAQGRPATLFSIDLGTESIAAARATCSSVVNLICNDSVYALHSLARQLDRRTASLLYLDSFDLDLAEPMPSAIHHLMELAAAAPLLRPGSLIAVDDHGVADGGKGALVDRYMESVGATVLYSGYQKLWRLP